MAAPEIDVPVYDYLARLDPERFLPGVGEIPDEAITLLETNPRFVEALLVGLNSEMNRELLWRAFPTDQRGTPFRSSGRGAMAGRRPADPPLAQRRTAGPRTPAAGRAARSRCSCAGGCCAATRTRRSTRGARTDGVLDESAGSRRISASAVFAGVLGADIVFVGFDLTDADLTAGDGWFFVLQEQPTEPRFGFDELDGPGARCRRLAPGRTPPGSTPAPPAAVPAHRGQPADRVRAGGVRFVDHAGPFRRDHPTEADARGGACPQPAAAGSPESDGHG